MNIYEYINKFGSSSFEEVPINEVDYLILANISYINLDGIVYPDETKITLKEAGNKFFHKYNKKEIKNNIVAIRSGIKLLNATYETKRYQELLLYNYSYTYGDNKQFSSMFIDLNDKLTFISFEGTDELISGWKEDAILAYDFPTEGQKDAIEYVNSKIPFSSKRKYIFGGHSKGGNLALVAGMYSKLYIKNKIKAIYSFDGPGLRKKEFENLKYKSIKHKFHLVIPNYSVVGLLLRHTKKYEIVKSTSKTIYSHSIDTWLIDHTKFVNTHLSDFSKNVDDSITRWLDSYTEEEQKKMVEDIFDIFSRAGIDSIIDIKDSTIKSVYKLIKESKNIDEETKKMLGSLIGNLMEYIKEFIKDKIEQFVK